MKNTIKKEGLRVITLILASLIMAANIKTFVQTGGMVPAVQPVLPY